MMARSVIFLWDLKESNTWGLYQSLLWHALVCNVLLKHSFDFMMCCHALWHARTRLFPPCRAHSNQQRRDMESLFAMWCFSWGFRDLQDAHFCLLEQNSSWQGQRTNYLPLRSLTSGVFLSSAFFSQPVPRAGCQTSECVDSHVLTMSSMVKRWNWVLHSHSNHSCSLNTETERLRNKDMDVQRKHGLLGTSLGCFIM